MYHRCLCLRGAGFRCEAISGGGGEQKSSQALPVHASHAAAAVLSANGVVFCLPCAMTAISSGLISADPTKHAFQWLLMDLQKLFSQTVGCHHADACCLALFFVGRMSVSACASLATLRFTARASSLKVRLFFCPRACESCHLCAVLGDLSRQRHATLAHSLQHALQRLLVSQVLRLAFRCSSSLEVPAQVESSSSLQSLAHDVLSMMRDKVW